MRNILFHPNFLQLVNLVDLKHLQDNTNEAIEGIISSLLPVGINRCILSGCEVLKAGNTYTVSAGYLYFEGRIYPVADQVLNTINVPHWAFSISYLETDPIPLSNGNTHQAHQVGTAELVDNVGQQEVIGPYNEVYQLAQYVANMANVGTFEFIDDFEMYDAQGVGYGYKTGWSICNGLNDAPNLEDKFIMVAKADQSNIGETGGDNEVTLSSAEQGHFYVRTMSDDGDDSQGSYRSIAQMDFNSAQNSTPGAGVGGNVNFSGAEVGASQWTNQKKINLSAATESHENRPSFYTLAIRRRMI